MWPVRLEYPYETWPIALQNVVHASVVSGQNVVQESAPRAWWKCGSAISMDRLRHGLWMLSTVGMIPTC